MTLKYELEGAGWATATLYTQQGSASMAVSYLHDSLRELTEAALLLCKGIDEAEVSLVNEPGAHRLVFKRGAYDVVNVELQRYATWPAVARQPDEVILRVETTVARVRHQVLSVLWRIHQGYGADGYMEAWGKHGFPQAEYERLEAIKIGHSM